MEDCLMETEVEKIQSRRKFLKIVASMTGTAIVAGGTVTTLYKKKKQDQTTALWRLNAAFRLNEIAPDTIALYTHLGNGKRLEHKFSGLEADLFRAIEEEKKLHTMISILAKKHHLTEKECLKLLNQSIDEFAQTRLIYTGERMLVKIVEATNG